MNYIYKLILVTTFSIIITLFSHGQKFGGNPPSMKWKRMHGEVVDVLFSVGSEAAAKRVNALTGFMEGQTASRLGSGRSRIPVVLQTLPTISNAYVGLAPWRSEFFLFPPQDALGLGSTSWLDNLSIHEYRHVHQYANFRKGVSKFAYWVAGQEGQTLANAASIPDWFFEGDAVYTETKYLEQGRGRLPGFYDRFRSLWMENKQYRYQKLRSGSLKDMVPNHYELGYQLVDFGYDQFGDDFWARVTDDATRFRGLFYPFQAAVKKHSGLRFQTFVDRSLDAFKNKMPIPVVDSSIKLVHRIDRKRVVDHHYPLWAGGDSVLALRKPFHQLAHWVIFDKGKSTVLGVKNIGTDDYFTYKRGNIVYTAFSLDPRWQWKEFSDIVLFNIYDRKERRITGRKRYVSPDLSNDGQKLIAVDVAPGGKTGLELMDSETGKVLVRFDAKPDEYFSYPVFDSTDSVVYVISRFDDGSSGILMLNLVSGSFSTVQPFVNAPLSFLRYKGGKLIFTVSQGLNNQFWEHDLQTGKSGVLVSGITGSYAGDIHEDGERIVYGSPTAEGEQLFTAAYKVTENKIAALKSISGLAPLSTVRSMVDSIDDYGSTRQLINIHSWRPFYEQPEWSFSMYGQNPLNTMESLFEYVYNENEGSHRVGANLAYGGLYPWVTGGTNYTVNRRFRDSSRTINWNEWNGNLGLRLPLNFSRGKLYKNLDFSTRLHGVSVDYDAKSNGLLNNKFISYLQQQVLWSMQSQQAVQHIYPRFALVARMQHRFALGNTRAHQLYAGSQLYLPGILSNHALVMGFNYQMRDTLRQYFFSNGFAMARGYMGLDYPRMWRTSINYHMPLFYPDAGIGNLVYFLRIRSNFFYDDMRLKSLRTSKIINLRSAGAEVFFDTKWWNQQNVTFGVRYSRLLDTKLFVQPPNANQWEFIMPINLLSN